MKYLEKLRLFLYLTTILTILGVYTATSSINSPMTSQNPPTNKQYHSLNEIWVNPLYPIDWKGVAFENVSSIYSEKINSNYIYVKVYYDRSNSFYYINLSNTGTSIKVAGDIYVKNNQKVATENYVQSYVQSYTYSKTESDNRFVNVNGDTMYGDLNMNGNDITNVNTLSTNEICLGGECINNWNNQGVSIATVAASLGFLLPSHSVNGTTILEAILNNSKGDQICESDYGPGWHWCDLNEWNVRYKPKNKEEYLVIKSNSLRTQTEWSGGYPYTYSTFLTGDTYNEEVSHITDDGVAYICKYEFNIAQWCVSTSDDWKICWGSSVGSHGNLVKVCEYSVDALGSETCTCPNGICPDKNIATSNPPTVKITQLADGRLVIAVSSLWCYKYYVYYYTFDSSKIYKLACCYG